MGTVELRFLRRGVALLLLGACSREDYDPGDWQVDVLASLPGGAEYLRVCVEGAPVTELGAGNGRAAVPALAPGATRVRVEVEDIDEAQILVSAWTAVGDGDPYVEAEVAAIDGTRCADDGEFVEEGEDSRLLVLRFQE
ncbi:MAG: hypothetical protein FJ090_19330 [Deltaproteobacteria bacterium]|nr:hypothetical protein [Deltaproteobacteria bacterium]